MRACATTSLFGTPIVSWASTSTWCLRNQIQARPNLRLEEKAAFAEARKVGERHLKWESGYIQQQSSRPQTLGYGLTDSPVGQCAWILEKFRAWTDCGGDPVAAFGVDRLLDNISLYWLTASATSSARLYWESRPSSLFDQG